MKLDPQKTAILTLDLQKGIFGLVPDSERVMSVAAKAVGFARQNHFRIIHAGLGFSEGHPEIPDFETASRAVQVAKGGRQKNPRGGV